tara:strand:- start:5 stop:250 length:246 start_codon:yes stop_codon:yes gene_type:complete
MILVINQAQGLYLEKEIETTETLVLLEHLRRVVLEIRTRQDQVEDVRIGIPVEQIILETIQKEQTIETTILRTRKIGQQNP